MDHSALLAVGWGLVAAVSWGVSDFYAARSTRQIGPATALFYFSLIGVVLYAVVLAVWRPHVRWEAPGVWYCVATGVTEGIAELLFFRALAVGPVSLVSPLTGAYPLVSGLLAVAVFGGQLSRRQGLAIVVIAAGVMAAAGITHFRPAARHIGRGPGMALAAAALYGIAFACGDQAVQRLGWQLPLLLSWTVGLLIFLAPAARGGEPILASVRAAYSDRHVLVGAALGVIAYAALSAGFAADHAAGALTSTASACYPALTMLLALRHFKEDVRPLPLLGALATIGGVVLLSLG